MSAFLVPALPPAAAASDILCGPNRPDLLRDEVLADLFEATAARRPEHPALVFGDRTLCYA